jgi:hypothetical protein
MIGALLGGERIETECVIEVSHTFDSLHAHVSLVDDVPINPGDEVIVHGAPIRVPYGQIQTFRRRATVRRAGLIERGWTRALSYFDLTELYEVSFSGGHRL